MRHTKIILNLLTFSFFILFINCTNTPAYASIFAANKNTDTPYSVVVDLNDCKLFLINNSTKEIKKTYSIAGGKPSTPSPVGTWKIVDKGEWDKGFGTRWMGLNVPWGRYGIHGTNKPLTIGGYLSLGCIRMYNSDAEELYRKLNIGTTVIIYGGPYCLLTNTLRPLIPGNTGADVLEVQRRLNLLGYYNDKLDGVYDEKTKTAVIAYKKANKLKITHTIDDEFYKHIGILPFE